MQLSAMRGLAKKEFLAFVLAVQPQALMKENIGSAGPDIDIPLQRFPTSFPDFDTYRQHMVAGLAIECCEDLIEELQEALGNGTLERYRCKVDKGKCISGILTLELLCTEHRPRNNAYSGLLEAIVIRLCVHNTWCWFSYASVLFSVLPRVHIRIAAC